MTDEPKLITHIAYAKRVNLDPEMLALALDAELITGFAKVGAYWRFPPTSGPTAEEVVGAVRDLHRRRLRVVLGAIGKLEAEVESLKLDVVDALENGIDPVSELGTDLERFNGGYHDQVGRAARDVGDSVLFVQLAHRQLYEHDRAARLDAGARDPDA